MKLEYTVRSIEEGTVHNITTTDKRMATVWAANRQSTVVEREVSEWRDSE